MKNFKVFLVAFLAALALAFTGCGETAANAPSGNTPSGKDHSGKTPSGNAQEEDDLYGDVSLLEYELTSGGYAVVGLGKYDEGILNVPSEYNGKPVVKIGAEAFSGAIQLGVITIPASVKTIEEKAFASCPNLSEVALGGGVEIIKEKAFEFCHNIGTLTGLEAVVTVEKNAFNGCKKIKEIEFSDAIRTISDNAFSDCEKLEKITFGINLETVGRRAITFARSQGLTTATSRRKKILSRRSVADRFGAAIPY